MLIFEGKLNGIIVKEFENHPLVKTNKYFLIDNKKPEQCRYHEKSR